MHIIMERILLYRSECYARPDNNMSFNKVIKRQKAGLSYISFDV